MIRRFSRRVRQCRNTSRPTISTTTAAMAATRAVVEASGASPPIRSSGPASQTMTPIAATPIATTVTRPRSRRPSPERTPMPADQRAGGERAMVAAFSAIEAWTS